MRTTRLAAELGRMEIVSESRLRGYKPPKGETVTDRILQILKTHCRQKVDAVEWSRAREAVEAAQSARLPVPIGFLWAVGGHSRSRYKFLEPSVALPRLGDFWPVFWFRTLSRKIQSVYPPGIEVAVVDEVPQLRILGWSDADIDRRKLPVVRAAARYCPEMRIADLPDFSYLVRLPDMPEPAPEVVYAVILSSDCGDAPGIGEAFRWQYQSREKPWDEIRRIIPESLWRDAALLARRLIAVGEGRKRNGWMGREVFGGRPCIDACITERGRWCPDLWGTTFPQHGGTVLRAGADPAQFGIRIEPESRLIAAGYEPVYLPTSDVCAGGSGQYIFYWVVP